MTTTLLLLSALLSVSMAPGGSTATETHNSCHSSKNSCHFVKAKAIRACTAVQSGSESGRTSERNQIDLTLPHLVLKNGSFFLVTDPSGFVSHNGRAAYGLYAHDTRFLSAWEMRLNDKQPVLLNADISKSYTAHFLYANRGAKNVPDQTLLLQRDVVLKDGMIERWTVQNFNVVPSKINIQLTFGCDFKDIFEIRGYQRKRHGQLLPRHYSKDTELFSYRGLDHRIMSTAIKRSGTWRHLLKGADRAEFSLLLPPHAQGTVEFAILPEVKGLFARGPALGFQTALHEADLSFDRWLENTATISSSNPQLNHVLETAYRDIYSLREETVGGICIDAGVPWYVAPFGRDQCICALQTMMVAPSLSKEVLEFLGHYQGKRYNPYTEEEPGKIMHELRVGEMARAKEIPFTPYYGTVDATPLWLILAGKYLAATDDVETIERLWPKIKLALHYLSKADHSYLAYEGRTALSNQGWKDSSDSISDHNGKLAVTPIKLCEVQGYLYMAWSSCATVARRLGYNQLSEELKEKARDLKVRFNREFWMPQENYVALALDGKGRQCDVVSSNPGHLLFTGILDDERAQLVGKRLMQPDLFCGWGVRTLSQREFRYNPMSYHNGSVWPHDNGVIAAGLSSIGRSSSTAELFSALFNVAQHQPDARLPELFCGFSPAQFADPVSYPVSCTPQAWAAGSIIHLLTSCWDFKLDPQTKGPSLGPNAVFLPAAGTLNIKGLKIGKNKFDLEWTSSGGTFRSSKP